MFSTTKLLSFNDEGVQFAWDQTSLSHAQNCLRKYQYVMIEGWKHRHPNANLIFGGSYATALEHFHKHRAAGLSFEDAQIEVVHEALANTWSEEGPWHSDHNTKTRKNLIRTIVWYLEQFRDDPCTTVVLSTGAAAVEHSFALPVDNDIILTGHLDRLVEYGDRILIQDQKTTATTITPRYFQQYTMDNQMFQYTFAGRAIFHLPVKGVMIDAAQVAVGFSRFERGFVFIGEDQLNEWYDHTMTTILATQEATRNNEFHMNRTSCNDYGGCPFREVCNKSPRIREQFLKADFERKERWDPLKTR